MIEPRDVLEALLFASEAPVEPTVIRDVLDLPSPEAARELVDELRRRLDEQGRVLQIVEVGGGFRLVTRPDVAPWLVKLARSKTKSRLSRPALETLAIIAYRQPVSRPEVDATRGVNSEGVLDNLLERRLIRISGRKETAGRPFLYETTREFLVAFGLRDLGDLPKVDGDLVIVDPTAAPGAESATDAATESDDLAPSDDAARSEAEATAGAHDLDVGQTPGDVDAEASVAVDGGEPPGAEPNDIDEAAVGAALVEDVDAPARRVAAPPDDVDAPARRVSVPAHSAGAATDDGADAPLDEPPWEPGEVPATPGEMLDDAGSVGAATASALSERAAVSPEDAAAPATIDERAATVAIAAVRASNDAAPPNARDDEPAGADTRDDADQAATPPADAVSTDASAGAVPPSASAPGARESGAGDSPQQDPGAGGPDVAPRR